MMARTPGLRAAVVAGSLAAAAGLGWWAYADRTPSPIGVVLITLDTTRADRLSPYGFQSVSLPHLERLAREGVLFAQATSVAPLTLPAHTSLFTGLLPPNHGVRDNGDHALADTHTTLAETLRARQFRTAAFVGSVVLSPERGLHQGFEQYQGVAADSAMPARQRRADAVMNDAIRWLDTAGDSRFFLWTHLFDAHRPYDPPEPYRSEYGHNLYVGEIAFADSQIGRLLTALEERGLLDRTVIIVAGDHGEALGDHGERDHGIFIYEESIRVPLIVRAPGLRPTRIDETVRLTDVMPTVLDMLDVELPLVDGVSLVDMMNGRRRNLNLEAYSESLYPERFGWAPLRALRDGRFKFIDAPRPELYDLSADSVEEKNIYDARRAVAEKMAARLAVVAKGNGSTSTATQGPAATPELQAQLASLGYLGAGGKRESSPGASPPDPKDCISVPRAPRSPLPHPSCGLWNPADDLDAGHPP